MPQFLYTFYNVSWDWFTSIYILQITAQCSHHKLIYKILKNLKLKFSRRPIDVQKLFTLAAAFLFSNETFFKALANLTVPPLLLITLMSSRTLGTGFLSTVMGFTETCNRYLIYLIVRNIFYRIHTLKNMNNTVKIYGGLYGILNKLPQIQFIKLGIPYFLTFWTSLQTIKLLKTLESIYP